MSDIKPCPFCGHVGLEFSEGSTFRWIVASCGGCGAEWSIDSHRNPLKFTEFSRIIFADSKNTMQINTLSQSVQGFDSLHPLHVSDCRIGLFPSESAEMRTTAGRGIGPSGARFSHRFGGVA